MTKLISEDQALDALAGSALESFNNTQKIIRVDVERYQHLLDHSGLDEAEKAEVIESLWAILMVFVDLGFGVHPLQEIYGQEACGQLAEDGSEGAADHNEAAKMIE